MFGFNARLFWTSCRLLLLIQVLFALVASLVLRPGQLSQGFGAIVGLPLAWVHFLACLLLLVFFFGFSRGLITRGGGFVALFL